MAHIRFHYDTLDDIRAACARENAWLPLETNHAALAAPLVIHGHTLPNRMALQPMEGTDGTEMGAPGPLTVRRYERFAAGGASLIWFEAVAIAPEGRASAHQLWLTEENADAYARLVERIKEVGLRENGFEPLLIMQVTQSGRYAKPDGTPRPRIAYNNPIFEETPLPKEAIVTDDELRRYEEGYGVTARLAQAVGFDGIDIKACHRYLACELLSAYTRPGAYGGSFENRSRFLMNAYRAARAATDSRVFLTSRLNVYDGFPYPYGFGVTEAGGLVPDLTEPIALVKRLYEEMNIPLINVTIGNPYKNPHVNRPYDAGNYIPDEHPLVGVSRMMRCVDGIQQALPELPVMGSAFTYLRQFSPDLAAGMVAGGHCQLAGFGRLAFAYPDFPRDVLGGGIDKAKVCITCGQCAALLRQGLPAGCVVRDPAYRKGAQA